MIKIETIVRNLENQVGQLATTIGSFDAYAFGTLTSKNMVNLRENANVITLKIGKQL